jgi:protease-4
MQESGGTFGNVAIIPVHGALGKHLDSFEKACLGGCDYVDIMEAIELAEADGNVEVLFFDFRSPGGEVVGMLECGDMIANCAKPTVGYVDKQCCSAAYRLASQCDILWAAPSAYVGNVGCYAIYTDQTEALKTAGVKVNAISAGKYKLTGAPFKSMTDEERAMIQAEVDEIKAEFVKACSAKRTPIADALEGQSFTGVHAQELSLTDGTIDTMEEAVEEASSIPMSFRASAK